MIGVADGANLWYYIDGIQQGTAAFAGSLPSNATSTYLCQYPYNSYGFSGLMALALAWGRALSVPEIFSITVNPWQVFAYPQYYWLMQTASGGGSTASGSLTLGGFLSLGSVSFTAPALGPINLSPAAMIGAGSFASPASGSMLLGDAEGPGRGFIRGAGDFGGNPGFPVERGGLPRFTSPASGSALLGPRAQVAGAAAFGLSASGISILAGLGVAGTARLP